MSKELLILNYHDIHTGDAKPANRYSVHIDQFKEHLHLLITRAVKVIDLNHFLDGRSSNEVCVAITFDDGYLSQYVHALPELRKNNFPACFFITTGYNGKQFMQHSHIEHLSRLGFEIGSHSASHTSFTNLNKDQVMFEVGHSINEISVITGKKTSLLSLPFSRYNRRTIADLKKSDLRAVFSTNTAINKWDNSNFIIHRMNMKCNSPVSKIDSLLSGKRSTLLWYKMKNLVLQLVRTTAGEILLTPIDERLHRNLSGNK